MESEDSSSQWFQTLFKTHYNGLANYARTMLKDSQAAEDVVQSVFVVIWEKRSTFKTHQKIDALLLRAVRNKCIDYWRKNKRVVHVEHLPETLPEHKYDADENDKQQQLHALLQMGIAKLPKKTQAVFLLSRKDGLTYNEIAEEMEISVKTVENQMSRALRLLREHFSQQQ